MLPVLPRAAHGIFEQLNWKMELTGKEERFRLDDAKWGGLRDGHVVGIPVPLLGSIAGLRSPRRPGDPERFRGRELLIILKGECFGEGAETSTRGRVRSPELRVDNFIAHTLRMRRVRRADAQALLRRSATSR
jgi:hypothetical protein